MVLRLMAWGKGWVWRQMLIAGSASVIGGSSLIPITDQWLDCYEMSVSGVRILACAVLISRRRTIAVSQSCTQPSAAQPDSASLLACEPSIST